MHKLCLACVAGLLKIPGNVDRHIHITQRASSESLAQKTLRHDAAKTNNRILATPACSLSSSAGLRRDNTPHLHYLAHYLHQWTSRPPYYAGMAHHAHCWQLTARLACQHVPICQGQGPGQAKRHAIAQNRRRHYSILQSAARSINWTPPQENKQSLNRLR